MPYCADNVLLVKDPFLPWVGVFPYEYLNRRLQQVGHQGVGPTTSAEAILDSLDELLQAGDVKGEDLQAWEELRTVDRRLLLDFFFYHLEEPAAGLARSLGREGARPRSGLAPVPPERFDPGPVPAGLALPPALFALAADTRAGE